jgi:hypothetical protein
VTARLSQNVGSTGQYADTCRGPARQASPAATGTANQSRSTARRSTRPTPSSRATRRSSSARPSTSASGLLLPLPGGILTSAVVKWPVCHCLCILAILVFTHATRSSGRRGARAPHAGSRVSWRRRLPSRSRAPMVRRWRRRGSRTVRPDEGGAVTTTSFRPALTCVANPYGCQSMAVEIDGTALAQAARCKLPHKTASARRRARISCKGSCSRSAAACSFAGPASRFGVARTLSSSSPAPRPGVAGAATE